MRAGQFAWGNHRSRVEMMEAAEPEIRYLKDTSRRFGQMSVISPEYVFWFKISMSPKSFLSFHHLDLRHAICVESRVPRISFVIIERKVSFIFMYGIQSSRQIRHLIKSPKICIEIPV